MVDQKTSFPGAQYLTDMFSIWRDSLGVQNKLMNTQWEKLVDGSYKLGDVAAFLAQMHQSNVNTLGQVLRYPFSSSAASTMPRWCALAWNEDINLNDLHRTIDTRTFGSVLPKPPRTHVTALGGGRSFILDEIDAKNPNRISFSVVGYIDSRGRTHDLGTAEQLREFNQNRPEVAGQYLGMIVDQTQPSEPPLVIVSIAVA